MKLWMSSLLGLALALADHSLAAADCDLSTPAGIAAAYQQATGKEPPTDRGCLRPSPTFKGLVWTGQFASDRGCRATGILVGCKLSPPGYAATAMASAGWAKADLAARQKLALAWLQELDDLSIVTTKPAKFPKPFTAVTAKPDGKTLVLELWTVDPPGMRPIQTFRKHRIVFAADGSHDKPTEIDTAEIPMN